MNLKKLIITFSTLGLLIVGLFIFFNLTIFETRLFPSVPPQECPLRTPFKLQEVIECKRRFWGGWLDSPFLIKARGNYPNCTSFLNQTNTGTDKEMCTLNDPKRYTEVACADFGVPSGYKCFFCDEYPIKVLLGLNEDCSESVIYHSGGLKAEYITKQIPLDF